MGSRLDIVGLSKSFQGKTVLNDLSLSLSDGEFVSLLGPSGCGKTTTLNLVAGFFPPDAGAIQLDGRNITPLPTHERGVSMVFQNYALFPHMTVEQNIGFGLKMRGEATSVIARRVDEMLALVQLPGVAKRFPRQLSGGQQQRVGLARALAAHPGLLVLDEPMSNLDAKLRRQMQLERNPAASRHDNALRDTRSGRSTGNVGSRGGHERGADRTDRFADRGLLRAADALCGRFRR
jgi:ABC-type Fe3+/spermidine/putrescine transport system ATPase subunit